MFPQNLFFDSQRGRTWERVRPLLFASLRLLQAAGREKPGRALFFTEKGGGMGKKLYDKLKI